MWASALLLAFAPLVVGAAPGAPSQIDGALVGIQRSVVAADANSSTGIHALPKGFVRPQETVGGTPFVPYQAPVSMRPASEQTPGMVIAEPCGVLPDGVGCDSVREHTGQSLRGYFLTPTEGAEGLGSARITEGKGNQTVEELAAENKALRMKLGGMKDLIRKMRAVAGDVDSPSAEKEKEKDSPVLADSMASNRKNTNGATDSGSEGATAESGESGASGASGESGESGESGASGASGASGESGESGASGSDGKQPCGAGMFHHPQKGCSPHTVCRPDEFEVNAPTSALDRECASCTTSCPAGQEVLGTCGGRTNAMCHPCRKGTFKPRAGPEMCTPCANGNYAAHEGATSCKSCAPCAQGFFDDASPCTSRCDRICTTCKEPCDPGKAHVPGKGCGCVACPVGTESREKFEGCTPCGFGYAAAKKGSTQCAACPPGHFADKSGSSKCTPCPEGTFAPRRASMECVPHRICRKGEETVTAGTATTDRICRPEA